MQRSADARHRAREQWLREHWHFLHRFRKPLGLCCNGHSWKGGDTHRTVHPFRCPSARGGCCRASDRPACGAAAAAYCSDGPTHGAGLLTRKFCLMLLGVVIENLVIFDWILPRIIALVVVFMCLMCLMLLGVVIERPAIGARGSWAAAPTRLIAIFLSQRLRGP